MKMFYFIIAMLMLVCVSASDWEMTYGDTVGHITTSNTTEWFDGKERPPLNERVDTGKFEEYEIEISYRVIDNDCWAFNDKKVRTITCNIVMLNTLMSELIWRRAEYEMEQYLHGDYGFTIISVRVIETKKVIVKTFE